ncbi:hypothetical protein P7K49_024822 [Saguinus oedipus]|uniref:Uncharacterized protein n=1 Tax=Saguinus oedipus TaxID=9490 RepID=A0ABQ9UQM0_SAGOE|nr:hypothetical protein P7K49_024822 [Saguinus oedipus]
MADAGAAPLSPGDPTVPEEERNAWREYAGGSSGNGFQGRGATENCGEEVLVVWASKGDVNVIQPDYPAAARDFLHTFRRGLLGPVMLDLDVLQGHPPAETVP